jgi:hypothetical protein
MGTNDNTAIAIRPQAEPFEPQDLAQASALAKEIAQAAIIPAHLRNRPADVYATLLLGRDLGLTAMQAIMGIYCVEGRPSLSAQTAVALVKRSPLCRYFRQIESSPTRATYETLRHGDPEPIRMSYTIEDAQRAGLAGRNTWKAHPAAMLRARAAIGLARDVYPDVIANVYDVDEIEDIRERVAAEVITAPPPPKPDPRAQTQPMPAATKLPAPRVPETAAAIEAEAKKVRIREELAAAAKNRGQDDFETVPLEQAQPGENAAADAYRAAQPDPRPVREEPVVQGDPPPDESPHPADVIGGAMMGAASRGDGAALEAEAAKIPGLLKTGQITADDRAVLVGIYKEARAKLAGRQS